VMLNSLALTGGMVLAYGINIYLAQQGDWRTMFALAIIPSSLLAVGIFLLPESPRWLVLKNNLPQAKKILGLLRQKERVDEEITLIKESIVSSSAKWAELFQPNIRKIIGLGLALAVLQQITGINSIMYYAPTLFEEVGFKGNDLLKIPLFLGGINFIMTGVAFVCIDKFGRRSLLITGLSIMLCSLMTIAIALGLKGESPTVNIFILVACVIFIGSFAMSIGCIFWVLISEIYPTHLRAKAMGMITAANWFANYVIILSFLPIMQLLGIQAIFAFYAFACMISLLFTLKYIPETKMVSLERIQVNLMAGKKLREIGSPL